MHKYSEEIQIAQSRQEEDSWLVVPIVFFFRCLHISNTRNISKIRFWTLLWSKWYEFFWVRKRQNFKFNFKRIWRSRRDRAFNFTLNSTSNGSLHTDSSCRSSDSKRGSFFEYRRHNWLNLFLSRARFQNCSTTCVIWGHLNINGVCWVCWY
mgnify:CR=1 FL=1